MRIQTSTCVHCNEIYYKGMVIEKEVDLMYFRVHRKQECKDNKFARDNL